MRGKKKPFVRSRENRFGLPEDMYMKATTCRCAGANHNEQLEYFGDAVVEVAVRALVMRTNRPLHEANRLSQRYRSGEALALVARKWGFTLDDLTRCGQCLDCRDGQKQLIDVVEALVGALALYTQDINVATKWLAPEMEFLLDHFDHKPRFDPEVALAALLADHGSPLVQSGSNGLFLSVTVNERKHSVVGKVPLHARFKLYRVVARSLGVKTSRV